MAKYANISELSRVHRVSEKNSMKKLNTLSIHMVPVLPEDIEELRRNHRSEFPGLDFDRQFADFSS